MVSYYESTIEPIEYMAANFSDDEYRGFLKGNILKYISRAGKKGPAVEDLRKAEQYMQWLVEFAYSETPDESDICDRQAEWLRERDARGWT
jgi:hypothetical protein